MIYGEITNATVVGHGVRTEYQVRLGYKVNSQSIENNVSNIMLQLEARSINSNYGTFGFKQTTTIDGVKLSAKTFDMRPANNWKVFGTRTFDVTHDSNGEYSQTKKASFTTNADVEWALKSGNASVIVTLEKLHTPPLISSLEIVEENNDINGNETIVQFLSRKNIILDVSTYEDAKLVGTKVYNNGVLLATSETNELLIDFKNVENLVILKENERKYCVLTFEAIDDMGGIGRIERQFDVIEYFKPNLIQTSSSVKRNGQASGKVKLNLVGKFFNETTEVITNTISLQFAYWKKNEEESTTFYDIPFEKSNNDIILSDYALAINGVEIENVDKDYAYYFKIKATDKFENSGEITLLCPVGEYVWAEYRDRVDFKKITIKNQDPFEYSTEEKVIGTWIDGKPLYRRTFVFEITSPSSKTILDTSGYGFGTALISGESCVINDSNVSPANYYYSSSDFSGLYLRRKNNIVTEMVYRAGSSYPKMPSTLYAILIYTKIND